jgi:hypothetical protein
MPEEKQKEKKNSALTLVTKSMHTAITEAKRGGESQEDVFWKWKAGYEKFLHIVELVAKMKEKIDVVNDDVQDKDGYPTSRNFMPFEEIDELGEIGVITGRFKEEK